MNTQSNTKEDDQANELRNLFQELEQHTPEHVKEEEEKRSEAEEKEIDVLNLPPRKVVHGNNKRMKWKPSKPFLRLASILVIIIICLAATFYLMEGDFTSILHRL